MKNPRVGIEDILKARERLQGEVHNTPLIRSRTFSQMSGVEVYLKLENLQRGGSFKIRGAYNKISSLDKRTRQRGVVAASAGNHAQGVALAANKFGIPATVVMPVHAPLSKQSAVIGYGAKMVLEGVTFEDAYKKASEIARERGATLIETFNDETLIAGQGTIGLEIAEALPGVETAIVPIGGGGLISGIGIALKALNPKVRVIGVQSEHVQSARQSFLQGRIIETKPEKTIADGIAIRKPGSITFPIIREVVDDIFTVSDDEIAFSILLLMERKKIIVEGAGAVPLAALLSKKIRKPGRKAALVLTGGNIDVNLLERIIEKGLMKTGRILRLRTEVPDTPGALGKLADLLGGIRANILEISHDRMSVRTDIGHTGISVTLETHGDGHNQEIIKDLKRVGYKISVAV
ncbi:MAG: threonine ammonia-lyase [Nitrospinae bacterium]|nr:threonine ammonia-lyase [Nitrospinota bacterium]